MSYVGRVGLLVGMLISCPALAGVDEWTSLEYAPGGFVWSLAVAPSRPNVVYASALNGLYRSTDSGGTWTVAFDRDQTGTVAVHPADANTVYLLTGSEWHFEVSRDGGATWQEPSPTFTAFGARLFTTPAEPEAVYASSAVDLAKTTDRGASWASLKSAPGLPSSFHILDFEADPVRAGRLYLLISEDEGSKPRGFSSPNGGAIWTELPLPPGQVIDLAIDPSRPGSLVAVNFTSSVWHTTNFGRAWRRLSQSPLPSALSRVWIGGGDSPVILIANPLRHFVSRDGGLNYSEILSISARAPRTFAFHPRQSNTFYAGFDNGGVMRTDNSGATFGANNLTASSLFQLVASPREPGLIYSSSFFSVFRSHDGGRSWVDTGIIPPFGEFLTGAITAGHGPDAKVFVGFDDGVAVSGDRGNSWSFTCQGCGSVEGFLTTPADPDQIFALLSPSDSGSLRSTDGGETWQEVDFAPVAVSSTDAEVVLRKLNTDSGEFLEKSSDGGATWSSASAGFHEPLFVFHILPHPYNGEILWAATNEGLYKSDNSAASWARVWFEAEANDVTGLALDPTDPDTVLLLAREAGAPPDSDGSRYFSSRDGGATWSISGGPVLPFLSKPLTGDPHHPGTFVTVDFLGRPWSVTLESPSTCVPDTTTHCLNNGRFQVKASWRDFQGGSGAGQTRALTDDTGAFWFFRPENLEVAVKALDGSGVNGHYWVFYGALSNVEYSLDVVDTQTGEPRTYWNPPRNLASRGDTLAFEAGPSPRNTTPASTGIPFPRGACATSATELCLQGGRFRVEVEWTDFQGGNGVGQATALTADTGSFWFFNDRNVELLVKVLDGRPVNGHFWVFYGALTNVGYTLRLTDTETGEVRTYENPAGRFGSRADTTAF